MMKTIKNNTFSAKKDIVELITSNKSELKLLGLPFYCSLYSAILSEKNLESYRPSSNSITRYSILK
jgi:hypothetical protein